MGQNAVVLGGSMAGLLSAVAVADSFELVTIVERDDLSGGVDSAARRGVPQGRHAHGLLATGLQALEELLPGATAELIAAGVPAGDMCGRIRMCASGRRLAQEDVGIVGLAMSRPLLENYVRSRVRALPNVTIRDMTDIVGIETRADRVTGARVFSRSSGDGARVLPSDLVIDATGRGSRMPLWLTDAGHPAPEEERLDVDLGYTSREFAMTQDDLDGDMAIITGPTREHPRGGVVQAIEGGRGIVTLFGLLGDHPPVDKEGFIAFAKTLPLPFAYQVVTSCEPLDDFRLFRFPGSVRRRYDKLRTLPLGVCVIGDAVCSFNPMYGQGMSVAAAQALLLRDDVRRGFDAERFFASLKPVLQAPWQIATGGDLDFPGVAGHRTPMVRFVNAYLRRLHAAAEHDASLAIAFAKVSNLLTPPSSLLRPDRAFRTLVGGRASRTSPTTEPVGYGA